MNSIDRSRRRLAIAAAGLAGFVDAVGFLSASGYFVSFMSGNTTRLAVDLMTQPRLAIVPAMLIAGFVLGVFSGAVLAARAGSRRKVAVLMLVTLLLVSAAVAQLAGAVIAMLGFLVLAMGALNNTFQRDGEVAIGLTYMTGALVRMAQGLAARAMGQREAPWRARLGLWAALALGAVAGALVAVTWPSVVLWLLAGGAAALAWSARRLA